MSFKSKALNILIALTIAVTFIPVTGQFAFAEGEEPTTALPAEPEPAVTPAPKPKAPAPAPAFSTTGQVKGLKIKSRTYKSVRVCWSAYAKASGYELYRADKKTGKYKRIKTLSALSFNDTGNKTLGKYKYYKVRAYANIGGKKKYSKYSSILKACPVLPKPKTVTTSGATGAVKISWSGVTGANKYQVYRATSKSGKYKKIKTTKSKSYTDKSISDGKKYFYKVRAYRKVKNKKKYSSFTSPSEGMALLGNVGNLNVTINSKTGVVTASWAATKGAAGYQLQRALAGGSYATVATTKERSGKDTLTKSGSYIYRVRAYAVVNGKKQYGAYSSAGGRGNALAQAQSWVGCKESNGSHKKIIDVFNNYKPACGKIGYKTAWCAAFVSAVAIKTKNTAVIPVHSYCPSMLSKFKNKTYNKKYTPQGADVIFFDWNFNKVPDHVGMVEKVSGNNVTTIEGNYSDAVKRRTFKKGYSLLLAYGLPSYTIRNTVSYTAPAPPPPAPEPEPEPAEEPAPDEAAVETACQAIEETLAPQEPETEVTETEVTETQAPAAEEAEAGKDAFAAEEPEEAAAAEPAEDAEEPAVEEPAAAAGAGEEPAEEPSEEPAAATEVETAEAIVEYIQEEAPAEEAGVDEAETSAFNAFLAYEVCDEMDIDACVVTVTEADGSESSYNEVVLDGELYILDATEEGGVLEKYTPEEIN